MVDRTMGRNGLTRRTLLQVGAASVAGAGSLRRDASARTGKATPFPGPAAVDAAEWVAYGRDPGGMRHSPLRQITRENVRQLSVAWTYHTGELATYEGTNLAEKAEFETTPLMIDGVLYLTTPTNRVIALDAGSGAERWIFDPRIDRSSNFSEVTSRGVASWADPDVAPGDPAHRRLYLGTIDGRLISLDAASGQPVPASAALVSSTSRKESICAIPATIRSPRRRP